MGHLSWAERRRQCREYEVWMWVWDPKRKTYGHVMKADELKMNEAAELMRSIPLNSNTPQVDLFYDDGIRCEKVAYREVYDDGGEPYEEWLEVTI